MDELDTYIANAVAQGKPYSLIYQELINVGWDPSVVAAKINAKTEKSPKPSVNTISPTALFAATIVVVALIVFMVVSIWASLR